MSRRLLFPGIVYLLKRVDELPPVTVLTEGADDLLTRVVESESLKRFSPDLLASLYSTVCTWGCNSPVQTEALIVEAVDLDLAEDQDDRWYQNFTDLVIEIYEKRKDPKEDETEDSIDDFDAPEDLTPEKALDHFLRDLEALGLSEAAGDPGEPPGTGGGEGTKEPVGPTVTGKSMWAWSMITSEQRKMIKFIGEIARKRRAVRISYKNKVTTGKSVNRTIFPYSLRTRLIHINGYSRPKVVTPVLFGYDPYKGTIKMFVIAKIRSASTSGKKYTPRWRVELQ